MAGTVRTRAGLLTEDTNVYLNDNTSGDIDPVDHRTSNEDHSASAPNFLDDNFSIDGDGSHKYTVDPTGAWDGSATHDLKFIPKKWLDDTLSTFPTSLENGLNVLGGVGRLGGDLTENTIIDLRDTVNVADRNLEVEYGLSNVKVFQLIGNGSWTLGSGATTFGIRSVSIGNGSVANQDTSISIGYLAGSTSGSTVANGNEISIGSSANGGTSNIGQESIAIGVSADSIAGFSIALGKNAQATSGNGAVAIGNGSSASGADAPIAIGQNALSNGTRAIAIGNADATGGDSFSAGHLSQSSGTNSVALAILAVASGAQAVAIGRGADATNTSTVAIGDNAQATFSETLALGSNTQATANRATAIGNDVINNRADSFAWGTNGTTPLFHFDNSGYWLVSGLQTFADDASAGVGGLTTNEIYKTATGELRIKL